MAPKRITLSDIARELNISTQSVSMALRNHRSISEKTRQRVHAKAREMGYTVDPALSSLVSYRTRTREKGKRWTTVALLHDWTSTKSWQEDQYSHRFYQYLVESAQRLGYTIEVSWLGHQGANAEACYRKLYNKGITGLILAPHSMDLEPKPIEVPRDRFQVVTCGPEHLYPELLTVQIDFYENLRLAWSVLRKKGYQRIGLTYLQRQGWRTNDAWCAAYFIEKRNAGLPAEDLPPFVIDDLHNQSREQYAAWLSKQKPDAIISACHKTYCWTRELAPHIYIAEMNPSDPSCPGVDLNLEHLAHAAIDTLTFAMQRSLTCEQTFPYRLHIHGKWREPQ